MGSADSKQGLGEQDRGQGGKGSERKGLSRITDFVVDSGLENVRSAITAGLE